MDECTAPGIFWPYGNQELKMQLAYLLWNNNCKANLAQVLCGNCTVEQQRDTVKKMVYASSLVDRQSDEIIRLTMAQ